MEPMESKDVAPQACSTCKKRKGKCDRLLPSCSFCTSKRAPCHYPPPGTVVQSFTIPQIEFPAVFFLDHSVFERSSLVVPHASSQIPLYISSELGTHDQIRLIASEYFSAVHNWMPIVSKRLFYDHHLNPLNVFRADVALLCLSMKLITWSPPPDNPGPITQMYIGARQFLDGVDMSVTLTLTALQGAILIALYEIGHAIYPAACLSVAACAEYAGVLGLGWKMASRNTVKFSWIEMEERRRVWWAVVILERYLALGRPQRHIISDPPSDNDLLPIDDILWDEGIETENYPMTTRSPGDINMGRFARLAQATHLLDRVLRHNKDSVMTSEFLNQEKNHLNNALHALMSFTIEEAGRRQLRLCCQTALCNSALFLLHDSPLSGHMDAKQILDRSASNMLRVSEKMVNGNGLPLNQISPLTFHWTYQSSVRFARMGRADPETVAALALEIVNKSLWIANSRWRSAGAYLGILDARQRMSQV